MNELDDILERFAAPTFDDIGVTHTASAIQATVMRGGAVTYHGATGVAQFEPVRRFDVDTPLDLASVSKVFTATIAMQAVDAGLAQFDSPIARWVDGWTSGDHSPVTLLHLLNHSSGLPAWDKFYLRFPIEPDVATAAATADAIEEEIVAKERGSPGVHGTYSDLGYILLGRILERIFDTPLEELVEGRIAGPLGLDSIRYVSIRRGDAPVEHAAATEIDPLRGRLVVGHVHDENCYVQGGVAGHAGLFGTSIDVARFGDHMLRIDRGETGIVSQQTLRFCWSQAARGGDGHYLGGWDTPSGELSSAGRGFASESTVGHLGFTGTSLWIERDRGVVAALLSNRVYPTRENQLIKPLRVAFHEAVLAP